VVEAVRSQRIVVPTLSGNNNRMTITRMAANGTLVEQGEVIAQFDPLEQMDAARNARGKQDDLEQQVQQRAAQNRADQEKRRSDLATAEADLRKAMLEVAKAEILPEINKQQNAIRAKLAEEHLASLKVSNGHREEVERAALRILELQRDRQRVILERAEANMDKLQLKAPIGGMVAHTVFYRNGSMTHIQVGDVVNRNASLMSIFDPAEMRVRSSIGEPDRLDLKPGTRATVYLDAYPELALPAHFESASPIVTSAMGSPIKSFTALFKLDQADSRLMPDLSAAVVLEPKREKSK
jgi:multidrug resistance efflux pump